MQRVDEVRRPGPPELWVGIFAAALGGIIGWSLVFAGGELWWILVGLATAAAYVAVRSQRLAAASWSAAAGYTFAFILLTWPFLWFAIGLIRYWITGQSLGD
jgi:hypothetical protein